MEGVKFMSFFFFFKNVGEHLPHCPSASLLLSANSLRLSSMKRLLITSTGTTFWVTNDMDFALLGPLLMFCHYRISEALNNKYITKMIVVDILKTFDKLWYGELLHTLQLLGRVFSNIKSFLTDRSMKVVINGHHSVAHEINAGVLQGLFLGPILFIILMIWLKAYSNL